MNLRELARKHTAFDGAVTFWLLEFHNRDAEIAYDELNRATPETKWVHRESGEETYEDPHDNPYNDPVIEEQRKASPWQRIYLWSNAQNIFISCDPITVDIEFKGKKLPAEVKALQMYWENRNGNHLHNWGLFRQLVSSNAARAWYDAYLNTRDSSFDGPEALQKEPEADADPNE